MTSDLRKDAEQLASAGKLTDAELLFAKAVEGSTDSGAFRRFGDFLSETGRLAQAEKMYERAIRVPSAPEAQAEALRSLGVLYSKRGEFDRALQHVTRAQSIDQTLGRRHGLAEDLRVLGSIHLSRGELDKTEEVFTRAHEIHVELNDQEGIAKRSRGELAGQGASDTGGIRRD